MWCGGRCWEVMGLPVISGRGWSSTLDKSPSPLLWSRVLELHPDWCSCWVKTWRRSIKELHYYGCLSPCSFGLIDLAIQDAKNHKIIVLTSLSIKIFGNHFLSLPLSMPQDGIALLVPTRASIFTSTSYIFTHFFPPELSKFSPFMQKHQNQFLYVARHRGPGEASNPGYKSCTLTI